jgi:hypothetical protein
MEIKTFLAPSHVMIGVRASNKVDLLQELARQAAAARLIPLRYFALCPRTSCNRSRKNARALAGRTRPRSRKGARYVLRPAMLDNNRALATAAGGATQRHVARLRQSGRRSHANTAVSLVSLW